MKVDAPLAPGTDLADRARRLEEAGMAGLWAAEVNHDPFLPLAVAARATSEVMLGTNVAVAFARSPMVTAVSAYDLHTLSGGRLALGLGSQVEAHITRRYGMPWSHPVRRMAEYVAALRAIWRAWTDETDLSFDGEYYRHTLMPPFFRPEPSTHGVPRVWLAAIGPRMAEVAGAVADGLLVHPLATARYLTEVTLPAVAAGRQAAGAPADRIEVAAAPLIATGETAAQIRDATEAARWQVAFYASTSAYRGILDLHGRAGRQPGLAAAIRDRDDRAMRALVDDDFLHEVVAIGTPGEVVTTLHARLGGLVDRVTLYSPAPISDDVSFALARRLDPSAGGG